jgi:serine phosphatase RsbU (regulator of sigma subunit)
MNDERLSQISDEPISQVLRKDIKARKEQQTDPNEVIHPLVEMAEQKVHRHAAWMMALVVLSAYMTGLILSPDLLFEYQVSIHLAAAVFLVWYVFKFFVTRVWMQFAFMRYFDVLYQVCMATMFLLISTKAVAQDALLWKLMPLFFLLVLLISALTLQFKLLVVTMLLTVAAMVALALSTPDLVFPVVYATTLVLSGLALLLLLRNENNLLRQVLAQLEQQSQSSTQKMEMEHAAEIQEKLIPPKNPEMDHLEAASFYLPSRAVGGDYYDFIKRPNGNWLFALGDVSGKGIAAAMLMSNIQAIVRLLAQQSVTLDGLAEQLNEAVLRASARGRFITLVLIEFDQTNRCLHYINCGHNAPLVKAKQDEQIQVLEANASVLGIAPGLSFETQKLEFSDKSTLFAYTDGLSELRNARGDMLEEKTIMDLIQRAGEYGSAQELKDAMLRRVRTHLGRAQPNDDLSFVCVNAKWES